MEQITITKTGTGTLTGTEQRMTSLDIAQVTGKPHNDVLKAIRKMEPAWEKVHQGNFSRMQIRKDLPNGGYRLIPVFSLTKKRCWWPMGCCTGTAVATN